MPIFPMSCKRPAVSNSSINFVSTPSIYFARIREYIVTLKECPCVYVSLASNAEDIDLIVV